MERQVGGTTLAGRDDEIARIDALLARAAGGDSGTLLISGEAGIGKSALLDVTADRARATGMTVLRAQGWESEAGIAYASLLDLLRPVLSRLDEIPPVQASALGAALALNAPAPHDSFAVPAGVLSLLALVAEDAPLVALVDDVQWVDEASRDALLFAARRLADDGIAVVLAERTGSGPPTELPRLEWIALDGLPRDQAVALAQAAAPGLARPVAEALAEQTGGNPLALRETPTLLSSAQREGREPLDAPLPPAAGIARALDRRVAELPDDARQALVVAAAMQTDVWATFVRALEARGLDRDALGPAERAGLVTVTGARFAIRHPLLRSSAYHGASDGERRAAHTALAIVAPDPRLRAWHLAVAAIDPDEQVAAQLDDAAADARSRGGHSAAARAWDRAAELSPDVRDAERRALDAGAAWLDAGHPDRALESIRDCGHGDPTDPCSATARRLRAQVELRRDPVAAHALLVAEADRLADADPVTAAGLMLEASVAHMIGGDMEGLIDDARRAGELASPVHPIYATVAAVVVAETEVALGNVDAGDPVLADHLDAVLAADPLVLGMEVIGMVGHCSFWIERWDRAEAVLDHCITTARAANAFGKLVYPLAARAQLDFRRGRWAQALAGADEAVTLARVTRQDAILAHALAVLAEIEAARGDASAHAHAAEAIGLCERFGSRAVLTYALRASALDHLAHDRVEATIEATERATAIAVDLRMGAAGLVMWMPDQVEALARAGRRDEAETVIEYLAARATTGGAWGPAAVARCRGVLAPADAFDEHFAIAIAGHEHDGQPFEEARTWLAWGERLRRSRRRAQAREPLTRAWELFHDLGATPWAQRAETELVAAGGDPRSVRPAGPTTSPARDPRLAELTPAELRVGLMVADGHRNREVAAALFLSPKTVERHLTVAYRKLDVRSRTELATVLQGATAAARS